MAAQQDLEAQQSVPMNGDGGASHPEIQAQDSDNPQAGDIAAAAALAPTDPNAVQMSSDNLAPDADGGSSGDNVGRTDSNKQIAQTVTPPEEIHDLHDLSRSMFKHEGKATLIWIAFTSFYWTFVVWIPALVSRSFFGAGFFGWCVGFVAMICSFYTYRQGAWPSGGTRENPTATTGIGRYTAFFLTACVCIDFLVLSFFSIQDGATVDGVFRGSCHMISLVYASLFFFNKFHNVNPDIAITAFFGEWLDVALTVIVLFVLHNALDTDADADEVNCFNETICVVYYISFIFQLMGWLFPMMLIEGWGTGADGTRVSKHLFVLDILTDIPIIMAILIEDAYKAHVIIFIDVLWKTVLTIRSLGYYLVYEIWLRKGKRVFHHNYLDRKRGDTLK